MGVGLTGSWSGSRKESGGGSVRVTNDAGGLECLGLGGTWSEAKPSSSAEVGLSTGRPSSVTRRGAVMIS